MIFKLPFTGLPPSQFTYKQTYNYR